MHSLEQVSSTASNTVEVAVEAGQSCKANVWLSVDMETWCCV